MEKMLDPVKLETIHPEAITRAQAALPAAVHIHGMVEVFKILGDASRLRILLALAKEELCVNDLAALIQSSVSSVSHHLRLLKNLKLVKFRKDGKLVYYSLADYHVETIVAQAMDHVTE